MTVGMQDLGSDAPPREVVIQMFRGADPQYDLAKGAELLAVARYLYRSKGLTIPSDWLPAIDEAMHEAQEADAVSLD